MKHQKTSGMLRGAWFILLLIIISGGLHAWQVDVFVNGSTEGPTMSFGEGAAAMAPMPPFSGMYGVVDVYLANPAGNPDVHADIQAYYNRLSVDIKASATRVDNRWVLVAGSNARLTWTAVEGAIPADFNIAWTEKGENKVEAVVAGATFSVKAGITYTLGVGVGTADVQTDPNNPNQMVGKDEDGNLEPAIITLTMPSVAAVTSYTISINLNAGTTLLAFPVYDGTGVLTKYKANNGTEVLPADIAAAAAWIIEVVAPGYNVALAWDGTDPNVLIAILTKNNTRADGDWLLSAQPTKTGIAPLSANTTLTKVDGTDPTAEELLGSLIAIIQQLGTLDFDGNGVANGDDAIFLFNFASRGGSASTRPTHLMPFTTNTATLEDAEKALNFFRANLGDLYFDGTDQATGQLMDNAIYLYNFASRNFSGTTRVTHLLPFTTNAASAELAGKALAIMREYLENN